MKSSPLTVNKCFEQLGPGFRKDSVQLEARPEGISRIYDGSGNEDVTSEEFEWSNGEKKIIRVLHVQHALLNNSVSSSA